MLKIRVKRVVRSRRYEPNRIDNEFVNATIDGFPKVGEGLVIRFDRFGYGTWYTSPVLERTSTKTVVKLRTLNSVYHVKLGWKETL